MSCTLPNFDEVLGAIKHRRALYSLVGEVHRNDITGALDHTQSHFKLHEVSVDPKDKGDDKRRYTLHTDQGEAVVDVFMRKRVSDRVNKMFRRFRTERDVDQIRNDPNNIIKRDYGTAVHRVAQLIGQMVYNTKMRRPNSQSMDQLKAEAATGEYPLTPAQFDALRKGVEGIINEIFETQKSIDLAEKPEIRFEQIIVDPTRDEGGTMDVVAIFSDKSAAIYDFKTMTASSAYTKGFGTGRELISSGFIYNSKREAWKLQMSTYKRTLMTNYGVSFVRGARVVPIWTDIASAGVQGSYHLVKSLNQLKMGKEVSEHLRKIHAAHEKTGIAFIDDFLKTRYEEHRRLKKEYTTAKREDKEGLMLRIRKLEDSIQEFVEEKDQTMLIDDAVQTAIDMYERLDAGETIPHDELNSAIEFIRGIVNFKSNFDLSKDPLSKQGQEPLVSAIERAFIGRADDFETLPIVLGALIEHRKNQLMDSTGDKYGKITQEGGVIKLEEDAMLAQVFLPGSESSNPFVRHALSLIDQSYSNTRRDLHKLENKLSVVEQALSEWLRSRGERLSSAARYFIDTTSPYQWARGNFVSKMSSEFYDLRSAARNNKDASFFMKNYRIREKNRQGETYHEWFVRAHKEQREYLQKRYDHVLKSKSKQAFDRIVNDELANWIQRNNLEIDPQGRPYSPEAWINSYWLELRPEAEEQYMSEKYKYIKSVPALSNYYDAMMDTVKEFREILGYDSHISSTFFPKIRAEMLEKMSRKDYSAIGDDIREMFSIREDEEMFGQLNPITGEMEKTIPVFFTQPFLDRDGNVDLSQQSMDIGRSMRLFAKVAYNYKHMSEIEAEVLAVKELLKSVEYYKRDETGKKIFDFMGNIAHKERTEGQTMTERVFNNLRDYHLYGIRVQPVQNAPKFTKNVTRAMNYLSLKALGLGFIPGTASYVSAKASAWVEGRKGMIYTSNQWNRATVLQAREFDKYHSFSYFYGTHNADMLETVAASKKGQIKNIFADPLYTSRIQKYINQRSLMRPFSYGDERLDNHITVAMAQNYGVDKDGNVRRLENLPEGAQSLWDMTEFKDGVMSIQGRNEEQSQQIIRQFRNAVRAGQRGIKGTMNEEDVNYAQTELILKLMMQFKTWMPGVLNERFGKLKYNDIMDTPQWGRYRAVWSEVEFKDAANTASYLVHTAKNALVFAAKSIWQYNSIARMLGGDVKLDETRNKMLFQNYLRAGGDTRLSFDQFMKVKKAQVRAAIAEAEVLSIFVALMFMLGADWDDDDQPLWQEMWGLHQIYKVVNRVQTELTFAINPFSYATLINNPFPISSLAIDAAKLIDNTADEMRDTLFGENNQGDKTERFHYSMGLIPGGYQLRKMLDLTEIDQGAER